MPKSKYRFIGQREDATIGLYFYNARYLDPQLGRFIQPDTIVPQPGDPQALNRYSYVLNNPIKYRDPSGHWVESLFDIAMIGWDIAEVKRDPSLVNIGALILDVGATALPFVPAGVGLVARGGKVAGKLAAHGDDAVKVVGKVDDVASTIERGVSFFGNDVLPYIDQASATLGRSNSPHFFSPVDDVAGIRSTGEAARETGMAPSVARAYRNGTQCMEYHFQQKDCQCVCQTRPTPEDGHIT